MPQISSDVRAWAKAMASSTNESIRFENLCVLHNIFCRELHYNNLQGGSPTLLNALENIALLYKKDATKGVDASLKCMRDYMKQSRVQGILLCNHGRTINDQQKHVSRIINVESLIEQNLPPILKKEYSIRNEEGIDKLALHLQNARDLRRIEDSLVGQMTGSHNFAFVTPTDAIIGMQADRIISFIGKPIVGREHWISIQYPDHFSQSLHVPTVLTCGPHGSFRPAKLTSDGWGRSVDMENFQDGSPEAVHEAFLVYSGFRISYLGVTNPRCFNGWFDLLKYNKIHC